MSKVSFYIQNGKMWINNNGKWCKKCPSCHKEIEGKDGSDITKFNISNSIRKNQLCKSCVKIGIPTWSSLHKLEMSMRMTGINHPFYGKKHSDEFKNRQRHRLTGRVLNSSLKKKLSKSNKEAWKNPLIRKKYIDALSKTKWIKVRMDCGQMDLINKWNKLGFQFEPNYQLKTENDIFYIDGYDKNRNVIIEYDSKYHQKPSQIYKDKIRQEKIIKFLNPKKFWRYYSNENIFIECMTNKIYYLTGGQVDG